jgi:hypothetical protein
MDRILFAAGWFLAVIGVHVSSAEDWPTYRHDNARSGHTSQTLAIDRLQEQWVWHSAQPPQMAWAGPARWDAYGYRHALPSMRDYDRAFHAVAAEGCVWFGSSADDSVYCLDATTGRQKWRYTTDGAVRIAPTYSRRQTLLRVRRRPCLLPSCGRREPPLEGLALCVRASRADSKRKVLHGHKRHAWLKTRHGKPHSGENA